MVEKWMTLNEISEHLRLSKETVYRLVYNNEIPFQKIGRVYRFKASVVDRHIEKISKRGKGDRHF